MSHFNFQCFNCASCFKCSYILIWKYSIILLRKIYKFSIVAKVFTYLPFLLVVHFVVNPWKFCKFCAVFNDRDKTLLFITYHICNFERFLNIYLKFINKLSIKLLRFYISQQIELAQDDKNYSSNRRYIKDQPSFVLEAIVPSRFDSFESWNFNVIVAKERHSIPDKKDIFF